MYIITDNTGLIIFLSNRAEETNTHILLDGFMVSKPDPTFDTYHIYELLSIPNEVSPHSHMYIDGAFTKNPAYRAPENDRISQLEALVDALLVAQLEGV